ncbi:hypothetical protein C5E02_13610 [Rathayibacter rathayi]|nr:hypothetical protein C1O28_13910 [Rathayibacter rathayi]PPG65315.1 hypothetical protein C5C16_13395 [Rathayibacter rathayi]PPG76138.1 hypothetical protein C5C15_11735 [Rathayibacter rathayi]PPH33646.1 hypothetical protein C5C28_10740 [Rathayibacter rathayi]PPI58719.1 hypothetical protein C5E02_13610 [Rathayibacter rathayi]
MAGRMHVAGVDKALLETCTEASDTPIRRTMSATVRRSASSELLAREVLIHGPVSRRARPPRPPDIRADALSFAGVKITGTEVLAVRTDLRARIELDLVRLLPSTKPADVIAVIVSVVDELGGASAFAGLGVTAIQRLLPRIAPRIAP